MNLTLKRKNNSKIKLIHKVFVFLKAQMSAFAGSVFDYAIMIFLTECFHIHYTYSIVVGGFFGAIINFSLNKTWTFRSKDRPYKSDLTWQLIKFSIVVLNSVFMKSAGTYLVTTFVGIDYKISRIIVDLFVSLVFNFSLQKYWVFRKTNT